MASSCFSASGNLPASNARYAVLYISSNSPLVGATLSAANEVSPSAAIAAIFQILMNPRFKPRLASLTSRNCAQREDFQSGSEKSFVWVKAQNVHSRIHWRPAPRRSIQVPDDP